MPKYPGMCRRCHFRAPARWSELCEDCREIKDPAHERKHREKIIPCQVCGKKYADMHGLHNHQQDAHGIPNPFTVA